MFIIVMGVSGSGKSTVGKMVAERIGCVFYDGDDYHPPENVAKMAAGIPLNDADRAGWLETLARLMQVEMDAGRSGVIACSVLKVSYRDVLRRINRREVKFVYLHGDYEVILERMRRRQHFMKPEMLQSQFDTLEIPWGILTIDVCLAPEEIVQKIIDQLVQPLPSMGIIGLGLVGRRLAQNLTRSGFVPAGYDPDESPPEWVDVPIARSLEELAVLLPAPRTVLLALPAAEVESALELLRSFIQPGDVLIDVGNADFNDTERRVRDFAAEGVHYIGMGVSGGPRDVLWGPSLMAGGSLEGWRRVEPVFQAIAARTASGQPCAAWVGAGGAGHFAKMVHNGIEYGAMQLVAEVYDLLHRGAGMTAAELAEIFRHWNAGALQSYLMNVTADILSRTDAETGQPLVDKIVDAVVGKGTGAAVAHAALELGMPIPTIQAGLESRFLSALRPEREAASGRLGEARAYPGDPAQLAAAAEGALYASLVCLCAQAFSLLARASAEYGWNMSLAQVARVWRQGSIIRAALLDDVAAAFEHQPDLPNLLLDEAHARAVLVREVAWREVISTGANLGIPMLALGSSLAYFDAYRSRLLPINLTQAQRDLFGAHGYRRVDRDGLFHTDWDENAPYRGSA